MIDKVSLTAQVDFFVAQILSEEVREEFATNVDSCRRMPHRQAVEERHDGREGEA